MVVKFAPAIYQIAYLSKLRECGLITDEEYSKISDYLARKYS